MAEGARLESVCRLIPTEGSNPSFSAINPKRAFFSPFKIYLDDIRILDSYYGGSTGECNEPEQRNEVELARRVSQRSWRIIPLHMDVQVSRRPKRPFVAESVGIHTT